MNVPFLRKNGIGRFMKTPSSIRHGKIRLKSHTCFLVHTMACSYPKFAIIFSKKAGHKIIAEGLGVAILVAENFEMAAIKSVQSILRTKPYKTILVLHNRIHRVLRKPLSHAPVLDMPRL